LPGGVSYRGLVNRDTGAELVDERKMRIWWEERVRVRTVRNPTQRWKDDSRDRKGGTSPRATPAVGLAVGGWL